jgi:hypothetical protein
MLSSPGFDFVCEGDFEEPWYWENYGRDLFLYSYYTDQVCIATQFISLIA